MSEYWLFGDHMKRDQISDTDELQFGERFRTMTADFVKTGASSLPTNLRPYSGNDQWTYLSKKSIETRQLYKDVCDLYDQIDLYLKR